MSGRRFNDKEVGLILKRATEVSHVKEAAGITLEELERIAAEAGFDPAAIRQAAAELSRGEGSSSASVRALIGGPTSLQHTFELDGELSEQHHEILLAAVQRNLAVPGTFSAAGRSFSWHVASQNRVVVVQVSPRAGKTQVHVEERLGPLIGGIYGGVGGGVGGTLAPFAGIGGSILLGPLGAAAGVALALGVTYVGSRAIYAAVSRRRKRRIEALADDLRSTLEEALGGATSEVRESERHPLPAGARAAVPPKRTPQAH